MKSRITIEIDFDNNNAPYIQIRLEHTDDIRDKILKSFLESLRGESAWLNITCEDNHSQNDNFHAYDGATWKIVPIKPKDMLDHSKLMAEAYEQL